MLNKSLLWQPKEQIMKIKINQCPDRLRWYRDLVGQTVNYIPRYDTDVEFGTRDQDGYINFVLKKDGEIVDYE